jgi:excisionase family DNA binding protein
MNNIMDISSNERYRSVFKEYPDVMDVKQASDLLGVSTKTVYNLIRGGSLSSLKVGREFRIPKVHIMRYLKIIGPTAVAAITE